MAGRIFAAAGAALGWFALALQLFITLTADAQNSIADRLVNFFSYFTILSNILVALVFTAVALDVDRGWLRALRRPRMQAAVALYIGVTGLVYFLILRTIWDPQGWSLVADVLLHYAMPVIYLGYWVVFAAHGNVSPKSIPLFLLFPVVYALYSLARGPLVHWYPYPFLDLDQNSTQQILLNIVLLTLGFALFAAMLAALDGILAPARREP